MISIFINVPLVHGALFHARAHVPISAGTVLTSSGWMQCELPNGTAYFGVTLFPCFTLLYY